MPIAACTAQIKQKTRDPMKTGSDVGTAHFVGYAEEVLLLRKELKAKPSTAIEVIDHYLTHYYTQETMHGFDHAGLWRRFRFEGASGGGPLLLQLS
jgi:predicted SprT family Zn-dependent metalloprotease